MREDRCLMSAEADMTGVMRCSERGIHWVRVRGLASNIDFWKKYGESRREFDFTMVSCAMRSFAVWIGNAARYKVEWTMGVGQIREGAVDDSLPNGELSPRDRRKRRDDLW